jgi:hypothetical protein
MTRIGACWFCLPNFSWATVLFARAPLRRAGFHGLGVGSRRLTDGPVQPFTNLRGHDIPVGAYTLFVIRSQKGNTLGTVTRHDGDDESANHGNEDHEPSQLVASR